MNLQPLKTFLMLQLKLVLDSFKKYIKSAIISSTDKLSQIEYVPSNDCPKITSKLNFPGPEFASSLTLLNCEQDTNLSKLKFHLPIANTIFCYLMKTLYLCIYFYPFFLVKSFQYIGTSKKRTHKTHKSSI